MIRDGSIRIAAFACLVSLIFAPFGVLAATVRSSGSTKEREFPQVPIAAPLSSFKVKVDLYYMPQCPGCRQLMTNSISEAFQTHGFSDMANVEFKPWGQEHRDGVPSGGRVFDNVVESCALNTIGNQHQDLQFMYIECIDRTGTFERNAAKVDRSCAKVIGLTDAQTKEIEECSVSAAGHALAENHLQEAESLKMEYAPWIVVNGHHSKELEDDVWNSLFHVVCDMYAGPYRSKMCPQDEDRIAEQL